MLPELFREPYPPKASRPHMPGYGILAADSGPGLLPWSWATQRLSQTRTYWLSTTRPDHRPHAMPIWGVWLNNDSKVRQAFAAIYGEKYQWNMDGFSDPVRVVWPVVAYGFSAAAGEFTGSATRWTFATTKWNRMT